LRLFDLKLHRLDLKSTKLHLLDLKLHLLDLLRRAVQRGKNAVEGGRDLLKRWVQSDRWKSLKLTAKRLLVKFFNKLAGAEADGEGHQTDAGVETGTDNV
jgi:hypothetical protein